MRDVRDEDGLDELLRGLRGGAALRPGPDVGHVVAWLGRRTGAEVALICERGTVEAATPGFPGGAPDGFRPLLRRLTRGEMAAAVTEFDGARISLEALGHHRPRPVLAVLHTGALPPAARSLASRAGSVLALLRGAARAEETARAYRRKAGQVRVAVLMTLLSGKPLLARRITTGAVPALLDCDRLRVHLLRCPPGDREPLVSEYEDAVGYHGQGLMIPCPVYDDHVICLVPEPSDAADAPPEHAEAPPLGPVLRRLVAENPRYALGVSAPHPQSATAVAYEQARHALAMARSARDRTAEYLGPSALESLLPDGPARAWAHAFLRPLTEVPDTHLDVVRLALTIPRVGVARLLGISRNTVTARLRTAEDLLKTDLGDLGSRAELALALALTPTADILRAPERPAPALTDLLATPPAVAWASALLAPLRPPRRPELLRTARAWTQENGDAQRAASRLGSSRNTVRTRLRTAEQLLGRDFLSTGSGVHDLVLAFRIAPA
ncbi:helix-turn-helix domain-containing protein [Streptomyces sp. NPDC049879]|uniref:helix-turn-helix domain-containing protein n=1 Tax=Streptomyces sp. NPDC049879 TaxID=3365598 RepID=UPI0037B3842D